MFNLVHFLAEIELVALRRTEFAVSVCEEGFSTVEAFFGFYTHVLFLSVSLWISRLKNVSFATLL
jgi:hypothetical protein